MSCTMDKASTLKVIASLSITSIYIFFFLNYRNLAIFSKILENLIANTQTCMRSRFVYYSFTGQVKM